MLQKSRGVFFQKKKRGTHIDHGVVGGSLKSAKIYKIHKIHAPTIQGRVFSEPAEAPQAITNSRTVLGGWNPETGKI